MSGENIEFDPSIPFVASERVFIAEFWPLSPDEVEEFRKRVIDESNNSVRMAASILRIPRVYPPYEDGRSALREFSSATPYFSISVWPVTVHQVEIIRAIAVMVSSSDNPRFSVNEYIHLTDKDD